MLITSAEVEELKEVATEGGACGILTGPADGVSLPAVIDLGCWAKQSGAALSAAGGLKSCFGHPALAGVLRWIVGNRELPSNQSFQSQGVEFIPVTVGTTQSQEFYFFQERFKAAMRLNGFSVAVAFALAGALQEVVENVEQHSDTSEIGVDGLAGYQVQDDWMSFSVGDTGRGVLASLHSNPAWAQLADSAAALAAITHQRASRRIGMGDGEGIKQLFKSLADLNGWLRFRSGDAFMELRGDGRSRREIVGTAVPSAGLQIAITCSRAALRVGDEEMQIDTLT